MSEWESEWVIEQLSAMLLRQNLYYRACSLIILYKSHCIAEVQFFIVFAKAVI